MATISIPGWKKLHQLIEPEDIYGTKEEGFGKETNPHVTILFGFKDGDDIARKLQDELPVDKPLEIPFTALSYFETKDCDVVKFDVESEDLNRLNKWCTDNFEYTNEFKDYHPHVTLAYVKKGTGKKYARKMSYPAISTTDKLVYSRPDKTKLRWTIGDDKEKAS